MSVKRRYEQQAKGAVRLGPKKKVRGKLELSNVAPRGCHSPGVQDKPKSSIVSYTWNVETPRMSAPPLPGQVKPQGTLSGMRV